MSMRHHQTGANGSQTRLGDSLAMPVGSGAPPDAEKADRSRSRSTARNKNNTTTSENLLVSLDEAVLPP